MGHSLMQVYRIGEPAKEAALMRQAWDAIFNVIIGTQPDLQRICWKSNSHDSQLQD